MAKKESTFINMVLVLFLVTTLASTALGFVYELTKEPIAASKLAKQNSAITSVVPGFDNQPNEEMYTIESKEGYELKVFPARKDGELIGVAIETITMSGFSGEIKVMVGLKPNGTIMNYEVLEHKETPGLGTKMDDWFKSEKQNRSIIGKNPAEDNLYVSKDNGEIDAITAATISSRAFLDAVRRAYETYQNNQKTEEGGEQ